MLDVSVITDIIECPQCKRPAIKEDFYVVGEERVTCDYCGYSHLITNENGKTISKGYGSIHYKKGDHKEIVLLKNPVGPKRRCSIMSQLYIDYDDDSRFLLWNDKENDLSCLVGNIPKTLEEQYQEKIDEYNYYNQFKCSVGTTDTLDFSKI